MTKEQQFDTWLANWKAERALAHETLRADLTSALASGLPVVEHAGYGLVEWPSPHSGLRGAELVHHLMARHDGFGYLLSINGAEPS